MQNGIAKIIPSTLSKKPPWPGKISLVSLTLALRLRYEINKSPNCDINDVTKVIIINDKILNSNNSW